MKQLEEKDELPTCPLTRSRARLDSLPSIPGFVLQRELGRGGMGVVYLAWQEALERPVAIKMMAAGYAASMDEWYRFNDEVRSVAHLHHPNIVGIYDFGLCNELPYCVFEYLGGGSLSDRVGGSPQDPRWSAELIFVLAQAVHAAHLSGIIHRDLKPGNVLFATANPNPGSSDSQPVSGAPTPLLPRSGKITDFGLAKRIGSLEGLTITGTTLGTPQYMAPEQASGSSKTVGRTADVYSLGAILYELLTGRPPFNAAQPMEILQQVIHQDPVAPSRMTPGVPLDLQTICLKCLRKEPSNRYESAEALADDLNRYLNGQTILARPLGPVRKVWRWSRRRPAVAGLLVALCLAIVVGITGILTQWQQAVVERNAKEQEAENAKSERSAKEQEAAKAEQARQRADVARRVAETNLAYSQVAQAQLLWERNDLAQARHLLAACPPERRAWEWYYLHRLCHSYLAEAPLPEWGLQLAASPNGKWVAVLHSNVYRDGKARPHTVRCYRTTDLGWDGKASFSFEGPVAHLEFDTSNRLVTIDSRETVRIFTPDSMTVCWNQPCPAGARGIWLSSDSHWLLRGDVNSALHLWDLRTGKPGPRLQGHSHPVISVAISTPGNVLAGADANGFTRLWELDSGKRLRDLPQVGMHIALSNDGRWLAGNWRNRQVKVLRTDTGCLVWSDGTSEHHRNKDLHGAPVFSPDGRWLALNSNSGVPRIWETSTGRGGHYLRGHAGRLGMVSTLTFSPDSRWVASGGKDTTVRLWDPSSGEEMRVYRGHTGGVMDLCFSPDGRRIVSVGGGPHGEDNQVLAWDLARDVKHLRTPLLTMAWPQAVDQSLLQFLPDGRLLGGHCALGITAWDEAGARRQRWWLPATQGNWRHWHGMALSANGQFLATRSHEDRGVIRTDLKSRAQRHWEGVEPLRTLAISPDGRRVAMATEAGNLLVWDAELDRIVLEGRVGTIFRLAFSPDGSRLALAGGGIGWLDLMSGIVHTAPGDRVEGAIVGLAFQPNGPWLAAAVQAPGEIRLYDTHTNTLVRRWSEPRILGDVAFHPSGNRVAVASRQGFVTLYDPETGHEVLTLRGLTGRTLDLAYPPRVAFSADGSRLATNDYNLGQWVWEADLPDVSRQDRAARRIQVAEAGVCNFHVRSAEEARDHKHSGPFQFHLDRIRNTVPPSGAIRFDCAQLFAMAGDWPEALAHARRWLAEQPPMPLLETWGNYEDLAVQIAALFLLSGDFPGYVAFCRQIAPPGGIENASVQDTLAGISVLGPDALGNPGRVVALARRRLAQHPKAASAHLVLGIALFRAGRLPEALNTLEMALAHFGEDRGHAALIRLGLALVYEGLGHRAEAIRHQRLAQTGQQLREEVNIRHHNFVIWLVYQLWQDEVRLVLERQGPRKASGTTK